MAAICPMTCRVWAVEPSFRGLCLPLQYGHGKKNVHFRSRPEDYGPDVRVFGRRGDCHLPVAYDLSGSGCSIGCLYGASGGPVAEKDVRGDYDEPERDN